MNKTIGLRINANDKEGTTRIGLKGLLKGDECVRRVQNEGIRMAWKDSKRRDANESEGSGRMVNE